MNSAFLEKLKTSIVLFDGAFGTSIEPFLEPLQPPEILSITKPSIVVDIHKKFVQAGSDVVLANTFGANRFKLQGSGYSVGEVISASVKNARAATPKFVALDIGPLGKLLKPLGDLDFEEAIAIFSEQIAAGAKAGVDAIVFETFSCLYELKAAIIAAKEAAAGIPIIALMTFEKDHRTFMGVDALTAVTFLNAIGVDAMGVNCSTNPFDIEPVVRDYTKFSRVPVFVMPNAGLPKNILSDGQAYSVTEKSFANALKKYHSLGASVFGGCCGTTPSFIAELKSCLKNLSPKVRKFTKMSGITGGLAMLTFENRFSVIGENLNPTGKPPLKQALRDRDFDFLKQEAIAQVYSGADALDINCGLGDINEAATLKSAVLAVQEAVSVPLVLDSVKTDAIEAAVRIYNGKPLINSVSGEEKSMVSIFPIAKKYGASVIGLTLDSSGIPKKASERFNIAKRIIQAAESFGIPIEDIVIDCLTLTASAEQESALETVKAVKLITEKLKVKTVLGISNISFGLANRELINQAFLSLCMGSGLSMAILNPHSKVLMDNIAAQKVLSNIDKNAHDYLVRFSQESTESVRQNTTNLQESLQELIQSGNRERATNSVKDLLLTDNPLQIINNQIIPALNIAGSLFNEKKIFLPKLLAIADIAKTCLALVNSKIPATTSKKDKIILATVKGDIHDIGKNIVKTLLQSHGYEVIDLGKSVDTRTIVDVARQQSAKLVGLSALMTSVLDNMAETVKALKTTCPFVKIMVGGAVLDEGFAKRICADFYAKDALAGVEFANMVLSK